MIHHSSNTFRLTWHSMAACFTALGLFGLQARADLLLNYTPPANDAAPLFAHSPSSPYSFASSFTVGQQDIEVTSLLFRLDGLGGNTYDFTAYLFADSVDHPGTLISSVQRLFPANELNGQGLAFYEFALANPVTLSAGVSYWAGIGTLTAGNPPYIAYTSHLERFSSSLITPSLTHCTAIGNPPSGEWAVNAPDITVVYELMGAVVPEPTSALLFVLGLAALSTRRLFRSYLGHAISRRAAK